MHLSMFAENVIIKTSTYGHKLVANKLNRHLFKVIVDKKIARRMVILY